MSFPSPDSLLPWDRGTGWTSHTWPFLPLPATPWLPKSDSSYLPDWLPSIYLSLTVQQGFSLLATFSQVYNCCLTQGLYGSGTHNAGRSIEAPECVEFELSFRGQAERCLRSRAYGGYGSKPKKTGLFPWRDCHWDTGSSGLLCPRKPLVYPRWVRKYFRSNILGTTSQVAPE